MSKQELLSRLTILLGGRVAEEIVFKDVTTGAHDDLKKATEIAREMVCEYGMSEILGPLTLGRKHKEVFLGRDIAEDRNYSEEIAYAIDKEVRAIIDQAYEQARDIILQYREKLDALASKLIEKEVLNREEIDEVLGFEPGSEGKDSGVQPENQDEGGEKKDES